MADDLFPELDENDDQPTYAEPATLVELDESNDQGSRWVRLTRIKRGLPLDHPWAAMYDDLVTKEILKANRTGKRWEIREPIGMLILLEDQAVELGLMQPGEAPRFTSKQCIGQMALAMLIKPVAAPRESAATGG